MMSGYPTPSRRPKCRRVFIGVGEHYAVHYNASGGFKALIDTSPSSRGSGRWKFIVPMVVVIVPLLGFTAWTWTTLHVSYSNGERVGYVQKISHKGWVCKTWEGELAMVSMPGTAPQIFYFSVPSDAVARKVMDAAGQRVALTYEQHRGVPSKCFGETEYFITGVRVLGP